MGGDIKTFYNDISHLMDISGIIYDEKQRLNNKTQGIKNALDSQNRMVFLNQSYANRMKEYSFMIMIIAITIVNIVLILFSRNFLPELLVSFLLMIVFMVGFIWALKIYIGIIYRDSVDFDKIYSPPANVDTSGNVLLNSINAGDISKASWLQYTCVGNACCSDNTVYNINQNKCVSPFTSIEQAYSNGEIYTKSIGYYDNIHSSLSFNSYP